MPAVICAKGAPKGKKGATTKKPTRVGVGVGGHTMFLALRFWVFFSTSGVWF
jgi:hypothetical protein